MRAMDKRLTTSQFTAKQIMSLFVPMLLDQFSVYAIDILSAAMVSASSQEAISAMGLVSSLAFMVTALFTALSAGGSVLAAQAKGRKDFDEIKRACCQTVSIALLISVAATALLAGFADPLVNTLFSDVEPLIKEYGIIYLRLYAASFIPFAIYAAVINCFRGMGEAKHALALTLIINITYLLLSILLINILDMGIAGCGYSYIFARIIGGGSAFFMMFVFYKNIKYRISDFFVLKKAMLKKQLTLTLPFAAEQILFYGGTLLTNTFIAKLASNYIGAHTIALSMFNLFLMGGQAVLTMMMTVCGQCVGAKNYDLAVHYTKQLRKFGRIVLIINAALAFGIMPLLLMLYKASAEVTPIIYQLLIIGAAANITLYPTGYLTPACLRSAGDASFTTIVSLSSVWVARVFTGYILTIVCGLGIYGVWVTYFLEYGIRTVCFMLRMRGEKWKKM